MPKKNDGGPAYPRPASEVAMHDPQEGMSLRDAFAKDVDVSQYQFPSYESAAKALGLDDPPVESSLPEAIAFSVKVQARLRYMIADAMLEERGK